MTPEKYFHFTLGPVQGFVAQARRTRDFWAGSFILSWLSAVAMCTVRAQNGKIIFPTPDENYLAWVMGDEEVKKIGKAPRQGGIPNRFKAEVSHDFKPEQVVENVKQAWSELAEIIWQEDLNSFCKEDSKTRQIWQRQINNFWEISWVLTDQGQASDLLDKRKNWRSYYPQPEPGVGCMMIEGWQELSGTRQPNRTEFDKFWGPIYDRYGLDLRDGERLCAIAFVKRRFARHFEKLVVKFDNWTLKGWQLDSNIPSVSYMAAVPWLAKILANEKHCQNLLTAAEKSKIKEYGEWNTDICGIKEICGENKVAKQVAKLDGSVFFEHSLRDKNIYPPQQFNVEPMLTALKNLKNPQGKPEGTPTPFYALLLMDGDSLGSQMSDSDKQPKISKALDEFTRLAQTVVYENNGFLVYAGGDDVFAILPVEWALSCAAQLRQVYLGEFKGTGIDTTLSGAIEFVHLKTPLTSVIRDLHQLLDDVAKDGCGRDAIAVRVGKRGGQAIEWAMPWECALRADNTLIIEQLAKDFRDPDSETPFSSKFFYKIRERFQFLEDGKGEAAVFTFAQKCKLLAVDYINSGVHQQAKSICLSDAEDKIGDLLSQCQQVKRDASKKPPKFVKTSRLTADGALLVRFLAHFQKWKMENGE